MSHAGDILLADCPEAQRGRTCVALECYDAGPAGLRFRGSVLTRDGGRWRVDAAGVTEVTQGSGSTKRCTTQIHLFAV